MTYLVAIPGRNLTSEMEEMLHPVALRLSKDKCTISGRVSEMPLRAVPLTNWTNPVPIALPLTISSTPPPFSEVARLLYRSRARMVMRMVWSTESSTGFSIMQ